MTKTEDLAEIISEIEQLPVAPLQKRIPAVPIALIPEQHLISELSGNYGALFIRSIFHHLGIDEHRVFRWRPEHKLIQYQLLSHYAPGCMPETLGLSALLNESGGRQKAEQLLGNGFFLKATLGDGSFRRGDWNKSEDFKRFAADDNSRSGRSETHMLQRKLNLISEIRVHSFGSDIIPALSFTIQRPAAGNDFIAAEKFVGTILEKLPQGIMAGTMIGWDIGLTDQGRFYVIEANFTGHHPEYRAGFQTTGFVDDHYYGPIICAWLNICFKEEYGIYINAVESGLVHNFPFYQAFLFYSSLFSTQHYLQVKQHRKSTPITAIIYLDNINNKLTNRLISYFFFVDFADNYHFIIKPEYAAEFRLLYPDNDYQKVWTEDTLFSSAQYSLITELTEVRRKTIAGYRVMRKTGAKNALLI